MQTQLRFVTYRSRKNEVGKCSIYARGDFPRGIAFEISLHTPNEGTLQIDMDVQEAERFALSLLGEIHARRAYLDKQAREQESAHA